MQFTTELKVTGMKASKGNLENGTAYDSTKVYVETDLDDSKGNAKGFATAEYGLGTSVEYDKYKHLEFPFIAKATLEIVSNGRTQKTVLTELIPTKPAKA